MILALTLEKPLLLEGEAGVAKTEATNALVQASGDSCDPRFPSPVIRNGRSAPMRSS
jgi:MoxR-like ATPase